MNDHAVPERAKPPRRSLPPLSLPRVPWWVSLISAAILMALVAGVVAFVVPMHPSSTSPQGSAAERKIAAVFGVPSAGIDGRVVGDLLVERFYAIDSETGDRYVGDFLKGRITSIVKVNNGDGDASYSFVTDLRDLSRDSAFYSAFVGAVAPPESSDGLYLGIKVTQGLTDAIQLNYTGYLPDGQGGFRGPEGESLDEFLRAQTFADVSLSPHFVGYGGVNFLVSNTELFPGFRGLFGINKAVFVSELIVVDTTSTAQIEQFYQIRRDYPLPPR